MSKLIETLLHNIQFMFLMTVPQTAKVAKLSEQLIIAFSSAFITGSFMLWVSNDRQDGVIHTIVESMHEVKTELVAVRKLEKDVAVNSTKIEAIERRNDEKDRIINYKKDRSIK